MIALRRVLNNLDLMRTSINRAPICLKKTLASSQTTVVSQPYRTGYLEQDNQSQYGTESKLKEHEDH